MEYANCLAILALLIPVGFLITFIKSKPIGRVTAWSLATVATICIILEAQGLSPFFVMLFGILAMFFCIKSIVCLESQFAGYKRLNFLQYLCFTLGWLGMRPYLFSTLGNKPIAGGGRIMLHGIIRIIIGLGLIATGISIFETSGLTATLFFLIGLSLVLHFGISRIQTGFWRLLGVNAQILFREPFKSKSLGEFWSFRWNLAFSEMTTIALLRPLKPVLSDHLAVLFCFVLSGVFHEIAISVPVNAGYGLPTLYFLIHGLMISLENKTFFKNLSIAGKRIWTIFWLIVPAPLLFHLPFIKGIVWPFFSEIKI